MSAQPGHQYPAKEGSKIPGDPIVGVVTTGPSDRNAIVDPIIQVSAQGLDDRRATEAKTLARQQRCQSESGSRLGGFPCTKPAKSGRERWGTKALVDSLRERDPATLTPRDKALQKKHAYIVRRYERLREEKVSNASGSLAAVSGKATNSEKRDAVTKPPSEGGSSLPTKKAAPLSAVGNNKPSQSLTPKAPKTARPVFPRLDGDKASTSAAAIASGGKGPVARTPKRQLSGDKKTQPEQKRVKTSSTLCSAPELQVAIIDRNHPEGKIPTDKWLLLEEKIMRALLGEIQRTKNNNIGMFDGAKWQKGVKVVGCGN
ncbi:PREDICTED: uncharacterized protein LOC108356954 [Rhagoletis zephyria]|uniref:uncharacterized protein LOC108356954 n=1 Tax=Rhagoletis zephyria TaxID=28612 RepID=UPI00081124C6|nr:PREDICTED: uncharacterized protein LOC108356954 [Rhagoletis zephyria]